MSVGDLTVGFCFFHTRYVDSKSCRQVNLMLLLIHQNPTNKLCHCVFTHSLALTHALPVVSYGFCFIFLDQPVASLYYHRWYEPVSAGQWASRRGSRFALK